MSWYYMNTGFNPFNPRDASKPHFASVNNDFIPMIKGFWNENVHATVLMLDLSTTSQ